MHRQLLRNMSLRRKKLFSCPKGFTVVFENYLLLCIFNSPQLNFQIFFQNIKKWDKRYANLLEYEKWSYQLHLCLKQTNPLRKIRFWNSLPVSVVSFSINCFFLVKNVILGFHLKRVCRRKTFFFNFKAIWSFSLLKDAWGAVSLHNTCGKKNQQ